MATPGRDTCCGSPLQVVSLTDTVDLRRCRTCGRSGWESEGTPVPRTEALRALSAACPPGARAAAVQSLRRTPARRPAAQDTAPTTPGPAAGPASSPAPASAPEPPRAELVGLLAGWQVHGSA